MAIPSESSALREGPERELASGLTASSTAVPVSTVRTALGRDVQQQHTVLSMLVCR